MQVSEQPGYSAEAACPIIEAAVGFARNGKKSGWRRNFFFADSQAARTAFRKRFNNTGIYFSAYRYSADYRHLENKDDLLLYGDFYLDLDKDGDFEAVRKDARMLIISLKSLLFLEDNDFQIYFSGGKGLHIFVPARTLGITPSPDLPLRFRTFAQALKNHLPEGTLDMSVYEYRRLFRAENSRHEKTGLYKIPLTYQELKSLSHEEIVELARGPRKLKFKRPVFNPRAQANFLHFSKPVKRAQEREASSPINFIPPCIEDLSRRVISTPRNVTLHIFASFLVRFQPEGKPFPREKIENFLKKWASTHFSPPLPDREVDEVINKVFIQGGYNYGCSTLMQHAYCSPKECPIGRTKLLDPAFRDMVARNHQEWDPARG